MSTIMNFNMSDVPEWNDPKYRTLRDLARRLQAFDARRRRNHPGGLMDRMQMSHEEVSEYNALQRPLWEEWNRVMKGVSPAEKSKIYKRLFPASF